MEVTLDVWRVPARRLGSAFLHMAIDPRAVRRENVRFVKFVGTGTGTSFGFGDADLTRYAALTVWAGKPEPLGERWPATQHARITMTPLTSRGSWSGQEPFGDPPGGKFDGMVLALTRARLRPTRAVNFWRAIKPVVPEVHAAPGLLARFGIGEAPVGWQGTVSVWRGAADLVAFAYRQPEHRAVIARTPADRWYAEELFTRLAVRKVSGDRRVLGWREER